MTYPKATYVYSLRLFIFLAVAFVIGLIFLVYRSNQLNTEFPELLNENSLNDIVSEVIDDGRGAARVTFESKQKYSLPWAMNYNYPDDYRNITRMVTKGDILIKSKYSDTVVVRRSGMDYYFIIKKTIQ